MTLTSSARVTPVPHRQNISESAGNPLASTCWRWRLTWDPFAIYQPASSSVGMYQMTDPTLAETRRYCIRDHIVVDDGCSWNALYPRVAPSRAVELTAVYLDRISRATERDLLLPFIAGLEHKAGGRVEGDSETDVIGDIWLVLVWSVQAPASLDQTHGALDPENRGEAHTAPDWLHVVQARCEVNDNIPRR
jgi:hypothetical protein